MPNKTITAILAFFLAPIGVHYFYTGDSNKGLVYLLCTLFLGWTVIVPLILWVMGMFQGVRILFMSPSAWERKVKEKSIWKQNQ